MSNEELSNPKASEGDSPAEALISRADLTSITVQKRAINNALDKLHPLLRDAKKYQNEVTTLKRNRDLLIPRGTSGAEKQDIASSFGESITKADEKLRDKKTTIEDVKKEIDTANSKLKEIDLKLHSMEQTAKTPFDEAKRDHTEAVRSREKTANVIRDLRQQSGDQKTLIQQVRESQVTKQKIRALKRAALKTEGTYNNLIEKTSPFREKIASLRARAQEGLDQIAPYLPETKKRETSGKGKVTQSSASEKAALITSATALTPEEADAYLTSLRGMFSKDKYDTSFTGTTKGGDWEYRVRTKNLPDHPDFKDDSAEIIVTPNKITTTHYTMGSIKSIVASTKAECDKRGVGYGSEIVRITGGAEERKFMEKLAETMHQDGFRLSFDETTEIGRELAAKYPLEAAPSPVTTEILSEKKVEAEDKDKVEVEAEDKDKVEVEAEDKDKVEAEVEDKDKVEVEAEDKDKVEVEVEDKDKVEVEAEDKDKVEVEAEYDNLAGDIEADYAKLLRDIETEVGAGLPEAKPAAIEPAPEAVAAQQQAASKLHELDQQLQSKINNVLKLTEKGIPQRFSKENAMVSQESRTIAQLTSKVTALRSEHPNLKTSPELSNLIDQYVSRTEELDLVETLRATTPLNGSSTGKILESFVDGINEKNPSAAPIEAKMTNGSLFHKQAIIFKQGNNELLSLTNQGTKGWKFNVSNNDSVAKSLGEKLVDVFSKHKIAFDIGNPKFSGNHNLKEYLDTLSSSSNAAANLGSIL